MNTAEKLTLMTEKAAHIRQSGGAKAVEKQHTAGKQTARERVQMLLDEGTFMELDTFVAHRCEGLQGKDIPGDGVVTGYGKIDGRTVFVFAQDFTVQGGALGEMHAQKICKALDMAAGAGVPVIGLNDSGGARIQEAVDALAGYGQIFYRNSMYSGKIPQISVIMGPCAGGAVYSPALTDFVLMVEKESKMFITGPAVIKATTGEEIGAEELGGADTHTMTSGVAHLAAPDEASALQAVRDILSYLPSSAKEKPPALPYVPGDEARPELDTLIPDLAKEAYDIHDVIGQIFDADSFLEIQPAYADNIVIGFARVAGRSVGIIANQPYSMGGCLDVNASDKAARFIQCCDAFNVPLVNLVDVPGFLPGVDQEYSGIIRHGAKLLYVYSVAQAPKITVVLRKAYGGSYLAMCSKDLRADVVLAWPTAEIAVMGADGAVNVIYRREIDAAEDKEAARAEKVKAYSERYETPYIAAERGFVDMLIRPSDTRRCLIESLIMLENKPRQEQIRGNMPL
ncbi:MAG: acyl-CoA carboxylase subunit beta [Clostridiales Family XIII bacterium]|jgi:acetyl-CoA carboxylase carboxyltransferase component|nr:acyl-CoA carboxylase subunit beta [Clostridiales Family XIII bacterium]